jgi:Zn-dependent M16 (insulinase) family peptidase
MTDASTRPAAAQTPNTFVLKRAVPIPSLNLTVEEYAHPDTGAQHLHLSSDSSENVFMVALRTGARGLHGRGAHSRAHGAVWQ